MRTIKVDPNAINIPSYGSASEAIAAEMATARAGRAAQDSKQIAGAFIRSYSTSDSRICLNLSNSCSLELTATGSQVEWRVLDHRPAEGVAAKHDALSLVWPSGSKDIWNPACLLDTRRECAIAKLFAGQAFVNVYFWEGGVLQFVPLWNDTDRLTMLYCFELEPALRARSDISREKRQ